MNNIPFFVYTIILSLIAIAISVVIGLQKKYASEKSTKVLRHPMLGGVMTFIALFLVFFAGSEMIGIDKSTTLYKGLLASIFVLTPAAVYYLDFLPARSLGGILLVIITAAIDTSFIENIAMRSIICTLCYLVSLGTLAIITWPYLARDFFANCQKSKKWFMISFTTAIIFSITFCIYTVVGIISFIKIKGN